VDHLQLTIGQLALTAPSSVIQRPQRRRSLHPSAAEPGTTFLPDHQTGMRPYADVTFCIIDEEVGSRTSASLSSPRLMA
jgi:hypothetical protein